MAFVILFMAAPARAVPSDRHGALRSDLTIQWLAPPTPQYWWGGLKGDITGMVKFLGNPDESGPSSKGVAGHFHEIFWICVGEPVTTYGCQNPEQGPYITGVDEGVYIWNSPTGHWKFQANGWVTGASTEYTYLIGYKYPENGWTGDPMDPLATYGWAQAFFAPA